MTDGDLELLEVIVAWAVTIPAVCAIIVVDERRLRGAELQRSWPAVSRDAAIFAMFNVPFGVFAIPLVHFLRTRRNVRGLLLGVAWAAAMVIGDVAAETGTAAAVGWLGL
jgi:hypothetical protein